MANKDLQLLYKMREILEREEYTVSYNRSVDKKLIQDVECSVHEYKKIETSKYNEYDGIKNKAEKISIVATQLLPLIFYIIFIGVMTVVAHNLSYDFNQSMLYLLITSTCCLLIASIYSVSNLFDGGDLSIGTILVVALTLINFIALINFFSKTGTSGFWEWILAIVVLCFWLIANFFYIGSIGFSVISWVCSIALCVICLLVIEEMINIKLPKSFAEKQKYNDYLKAKDEYKKAYDKQLKLVRPTYQKIKKSDNYSADKKSMLSLIPSSMQNLQTINELIWCIEEMYATDIVSARQWCRQEKHFAIMEAGMRSLVSGVHNIGTIQKNAAKEADKNAKAMLAAIETQNQKLDNQIDAIKKQTSVIKDQTGVIKDQTRKIEEQTGVIDRQGNSISSKLGDVSAAADRIYYKD